MKYSEISLCYHPTTVLFIDDDRNYLLALEKSLKTKKMSFMILFDPVEAFKFLKNYNPNPFIYRCISKANETGVDNHNIEIDVSKIRCEIFNPNRFEQISVIVIDYAMPGIDGLEFAKKCKSIKNKYFKILMLTGEADEMLAVKAFNQGIIDKFIRKDQSDFKEILYHSIQELQYQYFVDLSEIIVSKTNNYLQNSFLKWIDEPAFIKLFNGILQRKVVVEYYLTDSSGSFMFLNSTGKSSWLIVKSSEEMQVAFEIAQGADIPFPLEILENMKTYKSILYLHQRGGFTDNIEEARQSLHPATPLAGLRETYYYSFVDNPDAYNIEKEKVFFYHDYKIN